MSHELQINANVMTYKGQRGSIVNVGSEGYTVQLDNGKLRTFYADQLRTLGKPATQLTDHLSQAMGYPPEQSSLLTKKEELAARNMAALLTTPPPADKNLRLYLAAVAFTANAAAEALLEEFER